MYLRTMRRKNKDGALREYLCIVRSKREGRRVKQLFVGNLGRVDQLHGTEEIDNLVEKLGEYCKRVKLYTAEDISNEWDKEYGLVEVYKRLWEELGLGDILRKYLGEYGYKMDVESAIQAMVIGRLISPQSKLGTYGWIDDVYEQRWAGLDLHHFYRAMDFLLEQKAKMEVEIFEGLRNLFQQGLDLIMFDTTSIRYRGKGVDELIQYGYSRDKLKNVKQIIIGILMTREGIPVGHEVWRGDTSDVKAFEQIISKVKDRFKISRIIFIADRGMVSKKTIDKLDESEYEYIVGIKMRRLDKSTRVELLSPLGFNKVARSLEVKEKILDGKRYIICYNPEEAEEDARDREYFMKIIKEKIDKNTIKDWIIKNGYKKYLKVSGAEIKLDEERLRKEALYDGKWILLTNTDFPSRDISFYYKGLWQIERGFRSLKTELETAPIYHWIEPRIRAHIYICFLALVMRIALQKKIKAIDHSLSFSEVIRDVSKIKATKLKINNEEFIIRTDLTGNAHVAFKAVNMRVPNKIIFSAQK